MSTTAHREGIAELAAHLIDKEVYKTSPHPHHVTYSFPHQQKTVERNTAWCGFTVLCTHLARQSVSPCRRPRAQSRWAWPSGRCSTCWPDSSDLRRRSIFWEGWGWTQKYSFSISCILISPHPTPSWFKNKKKPRWSHPHIHVSDLQRQEAKGGCWWG